MPVFTALMMSSMPSTGSPFMSVITSPPEGIARPPTFACPSDPRRPASAAGPPSNT
jgi:hypothetical protein